MYRTLDVFVQLRVVCDQPDSDFVSLGDKERWTAPVCCLVGGHYYSFLYQLLYRFLCFGFVSQRYASCCSYFSWRRSLLDVYMHWGVRLHGFRAEFVTEHVWKFAE